ncbi:MAG: hypothetical protein CMD88_02655 [Gammaproteobacteria bacterium]|nr:hypothetical protein [Gammaproteobacteria bacterium]|tara:strand:+ start:40125 stop:41228 length:1104 start_codon:yes stop_codon:yes gene_type:complete
MNKNKLKMFDLTNQYSKLKPKISTSVQQVLESGQYILGQNVIKFEKNLSKYIGSKYSISCNSGTDALILSLMCLGITREDEVITSPFTYFATAEAITLCGAKPIFIDIDKDSFNINPEKISQAITKKTKAIIIVHIFGQPANMIEIKKICKKFNIKIIEDCAQSIGSKIKSMKTGAFGDFGCFSFFPTKNLGCAGDGGAIVTSNKSFAEKLFKLRNHGGVNRNNHEFIGMNSRLDEIQAAILNVKLKHLDSFNRKRNEIAKLYKRLINNKNIKLPYHSKNNYHVYNLFTLQVKNRDKFCKYLNKNKIPFGIYYPTPLYKQKSLKKICSPKKLPIVEKITKECVSIPMFPELDYDSIKYISNIINKFK